MEVTYGIQEDPGYILLADKDETRRKKTANWLKKSGLNILEAKGRVGAKKIIETYPLACVLCDWELKSLLSILKDHQQTPYTLLFCSKKTLIDAIKSGESANRLLPLPLRKKEWVRACQEALERYKLGREKLILEKLINTQHKKLQEALDNLENELKLGAKIQETLLTGKLPKVPEGINIEAISIASKEIDGDFYSFYTPTNTILDLMIGDVMGKGIASALVATKVIAELARFADPLSRLHAIKPELSWHEPLLQPEDIIANVHRLSSKELVELGFFVTCFYGRFDFHEKTFTYIDCGHAKPLLKRGSQIHLLEGENLPLGVTEKETFLPRSIHFKEGDQLLFYSDGVTEARSKKGEYFGTERLITIVKKEKKDLIKKIKEAIFLFTEKQVFDDDITLISVEINKLAQFDLTAIQSDHFPASLDSLVDLRKSIKEKVSSPSLQDRIIIALNEAFCNSIKHARAKDTITIHWEVKKQGISVEIKDNGISFSPNKIKTPSESGGFGWKLIENTADEVLYFQKPKEGGQNRLRLYFSNCKGET